MSLFPRRREKLSALLPWQIYALAAMVGLFAARYTMPALTMFCLLLLGAREGSLGPRWPFSWATMCGHDRCGRPSGLLYDVLRYTGLVVIFVLAWLYAGAALPHKDIPHAGHEHDGHSGYGSYAWITNNAQRVTGCVAGVEGLPDQRLRITLENVRPIQSDDADNPDGSAIDAPLHRVIWTWEEPFFDGMRIMTGQTVEVTLSIKEVHGFANPSGFDFEQFWAMKGAWHRAWSKGETPQIAIISEPRRDALWREALRLRVDRRMHTLVEHDFSGIGKEARCTGRHVNGHADGHADGHTDGTDSALNAVRADDATRMAAASVVMGILFGDRYYMDSSLLDYFAKTDLLHTLALSGQHLIIAGFIASLCVFFIRRSSNTLLYHLSGKKLFYLFCLPCAAFYLWLGSAPPSLVRASAMLLFGAIAVCTSYRQANLLDALLCALSVILFISPLSIYDLGLQLSSLAVASVAVSLILSQHCMQWLGFEKELPSDEAMDAATIADVSPYNNDTLIYKMRRRLPAYLWPYLYRIIYAVFLIGLSSTLIQVVLLPIQLMVFGKASPWFLLNMLWIPLSDLLVLPLSFMGMLCHTMPNMPLVSYLYVLGDACFWLAMQICLGMTLLLEYLNDMKLLDMPALYQPHWATAIGYGGLLLCLLSRLGRRHLPLVLRPVALMSLALFLVGPVLMVKDAHDTCIRMTIFDVGMGQAVYIRTPDDTKIMVDGGGFYSKRFDSGRDIVAHALTDNQWPRLDMIFNSHPDNDHVRGLIYLLRAFPVQFYGYNGDDNAKVNTQSLQEALQKAELVPQVLLAGMEVDLGSQLSLEILHPAKAVYDAGNNASLVMRLVYTDAHSGAKTGLALLCGDVETAAIEDVLRYAQKTEADMRAEILILPHHGSKSSYASELYDAVQPRVAIASCAKNHRYGYPNIEVRQALEERGIVLMSTGEHGAIHVSWEERSTGDEGEAMYGNEAIIGFERQN
ncbi:MAG: ComEC/Rec2 family competence protein [Pseudomonadota bacterium]